MLANADIRSTAKTKGVRIVNRNPDSPVVAIYRKDGFKDVTVSNLVSVNGRLVEDRSK